MLSRGWTYLSGPQAIVGKPFVLNPLLIAVGLHFLSLVGPKCGLPAEAESARTVVTGDFYINWNFNKMDFSEHKDDELGALQFLTGTVGTGGP